jgi:type IV pilus assembly protein PilN
VIRINLLPQEDAPRQINFKMPELGAYAPVAVFAAAAVICAVVFFVQQGSIRSLEADVAEAKKESEALAPQIARIKQLQREREQLDQRLDVITQLDEDRYFRVHLMSEIARRMPENCWLTGLREVSPTEFEIEGITFSNFVVADFLRDLQASDYYHGLDLVSIERGSIEDVTVLDFVISASVGQPAVEVASSGL